MAKFESNDIQEEGGVDKPDPEPVLDVSTKALEIWRGWLRDRNIKAIKTFSRIQKRGKWPEQGSCIWVKENMDLGQVQPVEWEALAALGLQEADTLGPSGGAGLGSVLEMVQRAILLGMGHSHAEEVPLQTWLVLWRMDESYALGLIGEAGYRRLVWPRIPGGHLKMYDWNKIQSEVSGVAVWCRGQDDVPIIKSLVVENIEELKPLFLSQNKEVRLLATQLAGTVRRSQARQAR